MKKTKLVHNTELEQFEKGHVLLFSSIHFCHATISSIAIVQS